MDSSAQKNFEIDQKLNQGQITETEARALRENVRLEVDYYSVMAGAAKILVGAIRVFAILFMVVVAGGVAVGIIDLNMPWQEALKQYVMLSCGYLVLFVVPLFLVALGFGKV